MLLIKVFVKCKIWSIQNSLLGVKKKKKTKQTLNIIRTLSHARIKDSRLSGNSVLFSIPSGVIVQYNKNFTTCWDRVIKIVNTTGHNEMDTGWHCGSAAPHLTSAAAQWGQLCYFLTAALGNRILGAGKVCLNIAGFHTNSNPLVLPGKSPNLIPNVWNASVVEQFGCDRVAFKNWSNALGDADGCPPVRAKQLVECDVLTGRPFHSVSWWNLQTSKFIINYFHTFVFRRLIVCSLFLWSKC